MKIRVGSLDFTVRAMTADDEEYGEAHGICDVEELEIILDADSPPSRQLDTFLHELMHAMWEVNRMPARAAEEHVAEMFGRAMASAIRDNPKLLAMLGEAARGACIVT